MATVPKAAPISAPAPAPSTRAVGPAARVAAVSTSQVDALETGTNISFDAAASGFAEQHNTRSQLQGEDGRRQRYPDPGFDRLFTANSQVFATIFENVHETQSAEAARKVSSGADTPLNRIIRTYEDNALIISGKRPVSGTELNFSL